MGSRSWGGAADVVYRAFANVGTAEPGAPVCHGDPGGKTRLRCSYPTDLAADTTRCAKYSDILRFSAGDRRRWLRVCPSPQRTVGFGCKSPTCGSLNSMKSVLTGALCAVTVACWAALPAHAQSADTLSKISSSGR